MAAGVGAKTESGDGRNPSPGLAYYGLVMVAVVPSNFVMLMVNGSL